MTLTIEDFDVEKRAQTIIGLTINGNAINAFYQLCVIFKARSNRFGLFQDGHLTAAFDGEKVPGRHDRTRDDLERLKCY